MLVLRTRSTLKNAVPKLLNGRPRLGGWTEHLADHPFLGPDPPTYSGMTLTFPFTLGSAHTFALLRVLLSSCRLLFVIRLLLPPHAIVSSWVPCQWQFGCVDRGGAEAEPRDHPTTPSPPSGDGEMAVRTTSSKHAGNE